MFGEDLGDLLWGRLLWPIDKAKAVLGYRPAHNFAEFLTALEAGDTGYYPRQASSPGGASEAPFPIPSAGLIRTRFPAQSSEPDCSRRRPVPSAWALLPRAETNGLALWPRRGSPPGRGRAVPAVGQVPATRWLGQGRCVVLRPSHRAPLTRLPPSLKPCRFHAAQSHPQLRSYAGQACQSSRLQLYLTPATTPNARGGSSPPTVSAAARPVGHPIASAAVVVAAGHAHPPLGRRLVAQPCRHSALAPTATRELRYTTASDTPVSGSPSRGHSQGRLAMALTPGCLGLARPEPASTVVGSVSVVVGTLAGPLGRPSTARLTIVPTTAGSGAELLPVVGDREPDPSRERRVVAAEIGEKRPST